MSDKQIKRYKRAILLSQRDFRTFLFSPFLLLCYNILFIKMSLLLYFILSAHFDFTLSLQYVNLCKILSSIYSKCLIDF